MIAVEHQRFSTGPIMSYSFIRRRGIRTMYRRPLIEVLWEPWPTLGSTCVFRRFSSAGRRPAGQGLRVPMGRLGRASGSPSSGQS